MSEPPKEEEPQFSKWMRLLDRFDGDQTIENYIAFRRSAPRGDTEIDRFSDVDHRVVEEELSQARLDPSLVSGALDGDDRDIDELCLQTLERLIERKTLEASGRTHLQARGKCISDALVDYLIVAMVESLQRNSLGPNSSLVVLIRERLGGANSEIYKRHKKRLELNRAVFLGMQLKRRRIKPTIRKVAEIMGVEPSTVSRWFPNGDFLERIADFERSFMNIKFDR
jgi:hypothetical protein